MEAEQTSDNLLEQRQYQPRALLFRMLSLLWVFPSLGAVWILMGDRGWTREGLSGVKLEQWVAVGLLLAHVMFLWLWFLFRRGEPPVPVPEREREED